MTITSRGEKLEKVIALGVAITLVAIASFLSHGRNIALADLGDGHTRAQSVRVFEPRDDEVRPGRITVNLAAGAVLVVCSEDFPEATREAVRRWNDRLPREVLTLEEGADEVTGQDECSDLEGVPGGGWEPNVGVVAVFVSVGASTNMGYEGRIVDAECVSRSIACVRQDGVDSTHRTRYGRLEVIVNPQRFCRDAGAQPTAACGIDIQPAGQDTDDDLHYLIAHELGHALSLGDYYCQYRDPDNPDNATNRHPDFIDVPTLMNSFSLSALALRRTCNSPDGSPTTRDVRDYRTIYLPAAVTAVVGSASGQIVTLTWDQSNVFVESGFEIQRLDGTTWIEAATAPANADSAELPGQLGGRKSYQVVAKTMALSTDNAEHGHVHGPPSEEVTVTVKFPVPGNPRVATPGTDSLNFEWDEVVGADGYDVRRIGRPDSSTCDSTAEEQATVSGSPPGRSHRFATGLKASTGYLLCVRATKAGYPDAASDWASTRATTKSRSVTPPQPTTKTCPDGTVVQINQPCPRPQQPAPVVETQRARQTTEYQWRLFGDGIPGARPPNPSGTCYIELYQRERYVLTEFEIPWRWDARQSKWVLDYANQKQVGLESDYLYTHWRAAGDRRDLTCPGAGGDSNGANAPATPEIGMLLPGEYVTAWGGERYSFTIPDGPPVNLETRRVGEQDVMVFSLATGVALAIVPPQAIADPPVVDDPTLAAIVSSFQLERDPANLPAGQERDGSETCVKPPDRAGEGALSLNLDAQWCLVVRGGDVTVQSGTDRIALTLPADRVWLVMAAPRSGTTEALAIRIIDRQTKSQLVLDPVSGTELSRRITDGADALGELFDAMIPKASDDSS